ncbi:BamA/TamA family outer membrane protein [Sandaracinus amylolyticus]|uniref:BamA/TamA family outer membrane protein n=1 Tax=Sandaracinus amylolyticus TaxID=927083 RepID=UPI00069E527E|nr:BamA/TamA family outer membrane protein [Sandaracinus amylolyticus]
MRVPVWLVLALCLVASPSRAQTEPEPPPVSEPDPELVFLLDGIDVRGNDRTADHVIRRVLPFEIGAPLDVDDERLEQARWQLLGTGFFDSVELSIERGRERGRVVLVVDVRERNTVLLEEIALGVSEGLNGERSYGGDIYVGSTLSETNLFGTGTSLQGSFVLSMLQQGLRLRFHEPRFAGTPFALTIGAFFLNAREVYGDEDVLVTPIAPVDPEGPFGPEEVRYALVRYHRGGGWIGTGLSLDPENRINVSYQLEVVDVLSRPDAASERRGSEIVPIDFALHDGTSFVSTLTLGFAHDERDDPGLTRRGRLITLRGDLASRLLGGDYDFFRAQALWREWIALPGWEHSLRTTLFVGAALGDAPVFYRFYAADLSDLVPSRMLELNLDRRTPPNLLGTAIAELRFAQLGARVDVEYTFLIVRPNDAVRALFGFVDVGLYALADTDMFTRPIPGYPISVPIDLTFDVGIRLDTSVGVFQLAFSTLVGFVSL